MDKKELRNIYCDESCHLQSQEGAMALGAIAVAANRVRVHRDAIRAIKAKHGLKPFCEMKWTGVSQSKLEAYKELVSYFFAHDDLTFRALVVRDKGRLDHERFHQTHDGWYYKMYFQLLSPMIHEHKKTCVYLDVKDTRGYQKVQKLHQVLCSSEYDFDHALIQRVQEVRSHEIAVLQFVDVFIGALTYVQRGLTGSKAKLALIEHIRQLSHLTLEKTTLLSARKFNLFIWNPQEF